MKKIFCTAILSILCIATGFAQTDPYADFVPEKRARHSYEQIYSFNWGTYLPLGSSADYISNFSLKGFNFNFTYFFTSNLGVGVDFGWSYNSKFIPREVYRPDENTAIAAATNRHSDIFPIKAQFKYMINPTSAVKVYASAGIGGLRYGEETHVQDLSIGNHSWGFLLSPEIGAIVPFGKDATWGLNANAGINWATNNFLNLYFNLGLYFGIY